MKILDRNLKDSEEAIFEQQVFVCLKQYIYLRKLRRGGHEFYTLL